MDEESAKQAVAAVLRFLTRMGIIKYESHSGYISYILDEDNLINIHSTTAGIFKRFVKTGEEIKYGEPIGEITNPYDGSVKESIKAPTNGILFYSVRDPLVSEGDIVCRVIRRLHQ